MATKKRKTTKNAKTQTKAKKTEPKGSVKVGKNLGAVEAVEEVELTAAQKNKAMNARNALAEATIQTIIERGKKKGFITYEEMNDELPD